MPNARGSILPLSKLVAALTWSRCCALVASRCRSAAAVGAHLVAAVAGRGAHLVAAVGACCRSSPRRSRCSPGRGRRGAHLVAVLRPGRGAAPWSRCGRSAAVGAHLVEVLATVEGRSAAVAGRGAHLVAAVAALHLVEVLRPGRGAEDQRPSALTWSRPSALAADLPATVEVLTWSRVAADQRPSLASRCRSAAVAALAA